MLWSLAVAAYAVLLCVLSLIPIEVKVSPLLHLDKVIHVWEYLLFAWLLVQALRAHQLHDQEWGLLAWMFTTSYGLLMELLQVLVPWRSADWADALCNGIGAAMGVWLSHRYQVSAKRLG